MNLDPEFSLLTRISLGRRGVYAAVAAIWLGSVWFGAASKAAAEPLAMMAGFCLFMAFPYAAIHVRRLEWRNQLDLHRLYGRAPAATLGWLVAGGAWWLLSAGAVFAVLTRSPIPLVGFALAGVFATGIAIGATLLAIPFRASIVWLWLACWPALGALLIYAMTRQSPVLLRLHIAAAASVALFAWHRGVRIMARAPRTSPLATPGGWRIARFERTAFPEFMRALAATEKPALSAVVVAAMPALVVLVAWRALPATHYPLLAAFIYGPFVGLAFMLSSRARLDRESGGLERIRAADQNAWRVVGEMALGNGASMILGSMAAAIAALIAAPGIALQLMPAWPFLLLFGAALGLLEGLRTPYLGMYVAPAIVTLLAITPDNPGRAWTIGLIAGIPVAWAIRTIDGRDAREWSLRGSLAAAAAVAAWLGLQYDTDHWPAISWAALVLAIAIGSVVPLPRRRSYAALVLGVTITGITAAVAERTMMWWNPLISHFWPWWSLTTPGQFALLFGAVSALGFGYGWIVSALPSQWLRLAARIAPLAGYWLVWRAYSFPLVVRLRPFYHRTHVSPFVVMDVAWLAALLTLALILVPFTARFRDNGLVA